MPLHDRHDGVITLFHFAGLPEHSGHLSSSNRGQWRQSVTDQPLRCGASTVTKSQDYRYYIEADQAWYYRTFVGRPGLDPGTLGLKEGCIWSDWSGGVGIIRIAKKICPVVSDSSGGVGLVCGMKCGKCDREA
jgi:hypothetical protein